MRLPSFDVMYHNCLVVILVKISAPISCDASLSKSLLATCMCVQSGSCVSPSIQWFHHLMSCVTTTFCHSHVGPDISTSVFSCNAPLCPPQLHVCTQSLTSGWFSCVTVLLRKAVGGRHCDDSALQLGFATGPAGS